MAQKRMFFPRCRLLAVLVAGCFTNTAFALPTDAQVAAGNATLLQTGNQLTINNSANAILNWQQFSIGAAEAVRFNQPSAASSVLNRVVGADPSSILGQLTSNGRVWLVNPAGILIGPNAHINTAAFVASTLNISNENFLAGKLTFGGNANAGSLVNRGFITTPEGGSVFLVAPDVRNEGIVTTPKGETILAAGQTVQLLDTATPGVKVEVTGAQGNATNLGSIVAEAGRVGIAGVLVKNSGTLNASSVVNEGGRIFLKATQDTYIEGDAKLEATGSHGGRIEALGNRVAVTDNAVLDASGQYGGGTVLVGGDFQGKNASVPNSTVTYFGPQASLRADALKNGDGGKIIVWANDVTRAYGTATARGGNNAGNGGFIEMSGHRYLDFQGITDTAAPKGTVGTLLLDPSNITIDNSAGDTLSGGTFNAGVFSGATDNAVLRWWTINQQSGALEIRTNSAGANGSGDINITASGTVTGPTSLTLLANRDINIAPAVTVSGAGDFNLIAGWNNTGWAVTPGIGVISLNGGAGLSSTAGNVTLSAGSHIGLAGLVSATAGNISITSQSGSITSTGSGALGGNTITLNAGGTIGTSPASRLLFNTTAPSSVVIGNAIPPTAVYTDMDGSITYGNITTATNGPIDIVTSGGTLTFNGDVSSNGGAISIKSASNLTVNSGKTINASGGTISILGSFGATSFNGSLLSTTNNSADAVKIQGIRGNLALGNITANSGGIKIGSQFDIQGDVSQNGPISGNSVSLEAQGNIALQAINATGGVTLRSLGNITDNNGGLPNVTAGSLSVLTRGSFDSGITVNTATFGKLYTTVGAQPSALADLFAGDLVINGTSILTAAGISNYDQGTKVVQAINGAAIPGIEAYQTSSGQVSLASTSGSAITIGGTASSTITGLTTGTPTPTTSGLSTNLGVSTINGNLSITAAGDISQSSLLTVTGTTSLNAGTANIALTDSGNNFGGAVTATGANVSLRDSGAITLNNVSATGAVAINAGGSITVPNGYTIAGNSLSMTASGGIDNGAGSTASTQVASLDGVTNSGSGDIRILNNGNLAILDPGSVNGYGVRNQVSGGVLSVGTLPAQTLSVQAPVIAQGGQVNLYGDDGVTFTAYTAGPPASGGGVFSNGGPVYVSGKVINMPANSLINATGGNIFLKGDNMSITGTTSITTGISGGVQLTPQTTTNSIDLGGADAPTVLGLTSAELGTITTPQLTIGDGGGGMPSGGITVSAGVAIPSTVSNMALNNTGAIDINQPLALGNASGSLYLNAGTSNITQAAPGVITANYLQIGGGGTVTLNVASNLVNSFGGSKAQAGNISFKSNNPTLTVASLTNNGNITLQATGGSLNVGAITATGSAVDLQTAGSVIDSNGATANVTANALSIAAANGIGLNTEVSTLTATNTATNSNGIGISNTGNLTVNGISDSSVGDVSIYGPSTCSGGTPPAACIAGIKLKNTGGTLTLDSAGTDAVAATGAYAPVRIGADGSITVLKAVKGHAVSMRTPSLTVGALVQALGATGPGRHVDVWTDALGFGAGTISAADGASVSGYSTSREISIAGSCTGGSCLLLSGADLTSKITAPTLAIGNDSAVAGDFAEYVSGPVYIRQAIDRTGGKLAFLSADTITQDTGVASQITATGVGAVTSGSNKAVSLEHASNQFGEIIGKTSGGSFSARSTTSMTVSSYVDALDSADSVYGVSTAGGAVTLTSGGSLLSSAAGVTVSGASLTATAFSGIGTSGLPLQTKVGQLSLDKTDAAAAGDVYVTNNAGVTPANLILASATNAKGGLFIENYGQLTTGASLISASVGDIALTAHSPLTIGAGGVSTSGSITLTAGAAASSNTSDLLTINGPVTTTGTITLAANAIAGGSVPTGANVTLQLAPPTIAQCTANPSLSGCSSVLPSLAACTSNPTLAGCTVVLPALTTCIASPTTAGCTAVLPSLATCTTNPTTAGCSVVLPTLATCTTSPTTAGCTAVLPSLATCTSNPATAGCTAVLPSLATCTTNPTTAGCSSVLPTLAACTASPTTAGCSAVLPSLASCLSNPALGGCSVVLPPKATETAATTTNEVVAVVATVTTTTSESAATTSTPAAPPPPPAPTTTSGTSTLALLNTNQTIGGTEGTFGGTPTTTASLSTSSTLSTGAGPAPASTTSTGTAGSSGTASTGGTSAGTAAAGQAGAAETSSGTGGSAPSSSSGSAAESEKSAPAKSAAADKSSSDKSSDKSSSDKPASDKGDKAVEDKKDDKKEKEEKKEGTGAKKEERKVAKKPAVCN